MGSRTLFLKRGAQAMWPDADGDSPLPQFCYGASACLRVAGIPSVRKSWLQLSSTSAVVRGIYARVARLRPPVPQTDDAAHLLGACPICQVSWD